MRGQMLKIGVYWLEAFKQKDVLKKWGGKQGLHVQSM